MTNELCILFYIYLPLGFLWHFSIWLLPSSFQLCSLYLVLFVFCLINLCLLQSYDKILPYYLLEALLFTAHFLIFTLFIFGVRQRLSSFFCKNINLIPHHLMKKKSIFLPTMLKCHLHHKSSHHICICLLLVSLFYSISLCVHVCKNVIFS